MIYKGEFMIGFLFSILCILADFWFHLYQVHITSIFSIINIILIITMFMTLVQIFFLCRHPAPNMTFWFIHIKDLSGLFCQCWVNLNESVSNVFMYGTFANPKSFGRLPNCGIVFDNITGDINCSFLNIIFQKNIPSNTVFTSYAIFKIFMHWGTGNMFLS